MVLAQNRRIDQWGRIESPEISPHLYGQLIFEKETRTYNEVKTVLNKLFWENWTDTCKIMKLDHFLIPSTKINSK